MRSAISRLNALELGVRARFLSALPHRCLGLTERRLGPGAYLRPLTMTMSSPVTMTPSFETEGNSAPASRQDEQHPDDIPLTSAEAETSTASDYESHRSRRNASRSSWHQGRRSCRHHENRHRLDMMGARPIFLDIHRHRAPREVSQQGWRNPGIHGPCIGAGPGAPC